MDIAATRKQDKTLYCEVFERSSFLIPVEFYEIYCAILAAQQQEQRAEMEIAMATSALAIAFEPRHPVRTRVARRLLPFLFVLYVTNFVDRANLAYAGLGMSRDLGFNERVFGMGSGIFFIAYLMLQIPGALIAQHWGPGG